jgi:maleamate amidohydrolase
MSANTRARSLRPTPTGLWTGATSGEPIAAYPSPATAVLAVDLQRDFLADDARMPIARAQVEPLLRASNAVLDAAHERGWPVVTIGNEFPPGDWLRNLVRRGAAIRGTAGAAIDPRVHPVSDAYFPKDRRDAFTNPALDAWLRDKQVGHVVVLGVMANACVRATVLGARNRGYRVAVVRDAVGAPTDGARETALARMAGAGVEVVSAGDLLRGVAAARPA